MIVVVIIGILAAVAIPSYQGFQDKAKATEAKVFLSSVYTSEHAWYAENSKYGNLTDIGLKDTQPGTHYTKMGFETGTGTAGAGVTFIGTAAPAGTTCVQTATDFIACAEKATVAGGESWSINKTKKLATY